MSNVHRPSQLEEEFFAREEAEKKRKLALHEAKAMAAAERDRLRDLHHMHCPRCGMGMHELTLRGVSIVRCFSCHGIFLDESDLAALQGEEGLVTRVLHFFFRQDYAAEESHGDR